MDAVDRIATAADYSFMQRVLSKVRSLAGRRYESHLADPCMPSHALPAKRYTGHVLREELDDCDVELGGYTKDIGTPTAKNIMWRVRAVMVLRQLQLNSLDNEMVIAASIRDAWPLSADDGRQGGP